MTDIEKLRLKLDEEGVAVEASGTALYENHRLSLERDYLGQYVVFDVDTGEYVVGPTVADVYELRKKKLSRRTWGCRIGRPVIERKSMSTA